MKLVSTMALGVALALGGAALIGVQPAAAAKKEKEAKGPSFELSKPVRDAVGAAQTAIKAGDNATAQAKLAEAKAAMQTPDDRYVTGSVLSELAVKLQSTAVQGEAVELMLASGKVPADQQARLYQIQANHAYNAQNFQKAEAAIEQSIKLGNNDPQAYAQLAETKLKLSKPQEALTVLDAGIAKRVAAGQTVEENWYKRGVGIAQQAKLPAEALRMSQAWLAAYPAGTGWRDVLNYYRSVGTMDQATELDVLRLMRAAGVLTGERDYIDYVQPLYVGYPGEADAVIKEGLAKGALTPSSTVVREFQATAKAKLASARAELGSATTDAKKAATGKTALATADAYLGFADYAPAIELYRVALQKGQVDANVVNTRLGIALTLSGQKDAAKQAFAAVTGPRADLAKFWSIYADKRS